MRFTGAGQVIYRGLEGEALGLQSMERVLASSPAGAANTAWDEGHIHGFPSRMQILSGSGSFGGAGVQGEAAKHPQSHISSWDGALSAPLCFPEPEFQEQR